MIYKDYIEKRQGLMDVIQSFINEGKIEEANEKMKEVTALDEQWDAVAEAQANMNALNDHQRTYNIQNLSGVQTENGVVTAKMNFGVPNTAKSEDELEDLYKSDTYKNVWAKFMMGKTLTADETDTIIKVNAYTHTTENTGVVIPVTVATGIWDMIEELFPLWNDVQKTYIKGAYNAMIGEDSTDSKWYDETTETEDGKETIGELALTGCELSRSVTVSWKLREMAVEDFIPYIQRKLARKMGAGLGYGVSHGKGKPSASEFKPEPLGIVTASKKETETPQVTTYTKGSLGYKDLTLARSKVKVGANELAIYANATTIWGELANVVDGNGRPLFIPDPANSGIYRILGMMVKEDDSMLDGEILMSSPFVGYLANVNKDMSVMTEEHVKARTVDYCGYSIVDGGVTSTKAHSLLEYTTPTEDEEEETGKS